MKRIRFRRDKDIQVQRFSDKLLLFFLSFFYLIYVFNTKKLRHVPPEKIIRFKTFVQNIVNKRLFIMKSPINPETNLFCRAGHEMINLGIENFEDKVKTSFCPKANDIVIDVGAHLGEYSLVYQTLRYYNSIKELPKDSNKRHFFEFMFSIIKPLLKKIVNANKK